jgi:hypothetical protein
MKMKCWFALFMLLIAIRSQAKDIMLPFLGKWEYRQAALPGEFDAEGEIIKFTVTDGKLSGAYFGLEREGEHGLFYSLVDVDSLAIKEDGKISFVVPGREFFAKRPAAKADLDGKRIQSAGFTKGRLGMSGEIVGDKLILSCNSEMHECPEAKMTFRKGSWPGR